MWPIETPEYEFNLSHISRRSLKILAESYAIKGLCLENLGQQATSTSKFKQAERESEMVCTGLQLYSVDPILLNRDFIADHML